MRLYEIEESINIIMNEAEIDEATGEVLIDFEKIQSLEMEKEKKIENIIMYYLDLKGDIDKFAGEIKSLGLKKKTLTNKQESLKRFLDGIHQGDTVEYGVHKVSYRKSKKLQGDDIDVLPNNCVETKHVPIAVAITAYLNSGKLLEGWEIVENQNIQIK